MVTFCDGVGCGVVVFVVFAVTGVFVWAAATIPFWPPLICVPLLSRLDCGAASAPLSAGVGEVDGSAAKIDDTATAESAQIITAAPRRTKDVFLKNIIS